MLQHPLFSDLENDFLLRPYNKLVVCQEAAMESLSLHPDYYHLGQSSTMFLNRTIRRFLSSISGRIADYGTSTLIWTLHPLAPHQPVLCHVGINIEKIQCFFIEEKKRSKTENAENI
jgi:hypothetical protein